MLFTPHYIGIIILHFMDAKYREQESEEALHHAYMGSSEEALHHAYMGSSEEALSVG